MVGEVDGDIISFADNNQGEGLAPGSKYCYRLLAEFPLPEGGTSYVSEEKCIIIEASGPVTTKVSVDETDYENGKVTINWIPPFEIDTTSFSLTSIITSIFDKSAMTIKTSA